MKQLLSTTSILIIALLFTACKKETSEPAAVKTIVLGSPANNSVISLDAAKQAVDFKWSIGPTSPMVTYRLRVWQLMQGQNGTTAMRTNLPIVTKDVADITEVTINGLLTGPCKPPYLCDFVWNVSIVTKDANGTITETAVSDTGTFSVN
jgi:hypothetical protein